MYDFTVLDSKLLDNRIVHSLFLNQGGTDRAHFQIRSPDRSTINERGFHRNNLFDFIVDRIDIFALKFLINLRHLLRRKYNCWSQNVINGTDKVRSQETVTIVAFWYFFCFRRDRL